MNKYIKPNLNVVKIQTQHMIATSPGLQGDEINPSEMEARGGFFWGNNNDDDNHHVDLWEE